VQKFCIDEVFRKYKLCYFTFDMHIRYWKLKGEALYRNLWKTRLRRGYKPVVRQAVK